jgi:hypothetical protein
MQVNLCMTSWKGRINNIEKVIESILNQTYEDFALWLTLSTDEFPDKQLPEFFQKLNDERIHIYWIKENTKTLKKVFPILNYLTDDDDVIITVDDDVIYDSHFVENRLEDFKRWNCEYPITSNKFSYQYSIKSFFCSCGSIFSKRMLEGYEIFVNRAIVETNDDDWTYTFIILLNGFRFKPCSKYPLQEFQFVNQENASSKTIDTNRMVFEFQKRIMNLAGKENFQNTIRQIRSNVFKANWEEFKKSDTDPEYVFQKF